MSTSLSRLVAVADVEAWPFDFEEDVEMGLPRSRRALVGGVGVGLIWRVAGERVVRTSLDE